MRDVHAPHALYGITLLFLLLILMRRPSAAAAAAAVFLMVFWVICLWGRKP
jgi:hypothetical protein